MKAPTGSSMISIFALAATISTAYGAQPPNVVSSDTDLNTAMGTFALVNLSNGFSNTASGAYALASDTTGSANTASGTSALWHNTTGENNTACGAFALRTNTTGNLNAAFGSDALRDNETGIANSASGFQSLASNRTGDANTASGSYALYSNVRGKNNTASGSEALFYNTKGSFNTASGYQALGSNTTGDINTADGVNALFNNLTGKRNVAVGYHALFDNIAGRDNTAIGAFAGRRITGNDNVDIASAGFDGESQTMRLGTQGSEGVISSGVTRTFIAGINGVATGRAGTAVMVDSKGQLGTISSSRRYKEDIQSVADAGERLLKLRPVEFRYKQADASGEHPIQFGLIAEEVAEVFPELVILNEDGQPETIAYHMLPALLLNELQNEHRLNQQQSERLSLQERQLAVQESQLAEISALKQQLADVQELLAALQLRARELQVAQR